ncbi:FUSC family protein [Occallatibacter riparius]|uniref:FUSC family protein n=1 Tax=Occallatibacter riparius TaxID=1002689 RepID=A0A9J7BXX2_9BACT|nr:FUSC family protein [Occallatibacter riparius]UWZ85958.1 FUSC family protein [Occallatibacter riparius]
MAASEIPHGSAPTGPHFLADIYCFDWKAFRFELPLMSASAVALCLFTGIAVGHPGGGLIAGGGAFTVGFGPNQRIADSRLIPMIAAVLATSAAALAGTVAGHNDYWLLVAAGVCAVIYGVLTTRHTGLAWVGQQAGVALLVASAFPTGPKPALERAGLLAAGGIVQLIVTSAGLRLIPDLQKDVLYVATSMLNAVRQEDRSVLQLLREIPQSFPCFSASQAAVYSTRLLITILIATEVYRRLGIQSGYWIPMTALLVQKPAWSESLTRAAARVLGTLAGAWLGSLFIAHIAPRPVYLAAITAIFALLAYATNSVNYALFTTALTGYIVFLLSLNEIPGMVIAHRRGWCTAIGAGIAVLIHVDALLRLRANGRMVPSAERAS